MHHVIWLMNCTMTKAVEGKTPYEAAFGVKADLSSVHKWGDKCWICVEKGNKLSGCVHEGHWVGVDDESNECQIYCQDTKMVTVECNIYFNPASMSVDYSVCRSGCMDRKKNRN